MIIRSSEEKLKTLMYSVWWFCFNYIQLLCGSNSYCNHNLINYKMAVPSSSGF